MLSQEEVKKIANLARLELSDKEINNFSNQLSDILNYLDQIKSLDLSQVSESISGAENIEHVLRVDKVEESDVSSLRQSYELNDGHLVAPNVFNK
jgi:aspartyl-tRNA(Asn)/glutamyl-tRNA(Gln) amidotransferase subunit C